MARKSKDYLIRQRALGEEIRIRYSSLRSVNDIRSCENMRFSAIDIDDFQYVGASRLREVDVPVIVMHIQKNIEVRIGISAIIPHTFHIVNSKIKSTVLGILLEVP